MEVGYGAAKHGRRGLVDTTALVHEGYVKLVGQTRIGVQSRAHFMRHILCNYARSGTPGNGGASSSRSRLWADPRFGALMDRVEGAWTAFGAAADREARPSREERDLSSDADEAT